MYSMPATSVPSSRLIAKTEEEDDYINRTSCSRRFPKTINYRSLVKQFWQHLMQHIEAQGHRSFGSEEDLLRFSINGGYVGHVTLSVWTIFYFLCIKVDHNWLSGLRVL